MDRQLKELLINFTSIRTTKAIRESVKISLSSYDECAKLEDLLIKSLNDEQGEIWDKLKALSEKLDNTYSAALYTQGFKDALEIIGELNNH